jgi:prefoldin subunit 5
VQNLAEVLSLERRLVAQMHQLIEELSEGNAYREVLERHIDKLEQAIDQLEALYREDDGDG